MAVPTPIRIKLLRLLKSHGLRRAERLREDEMRHALQELPDLVKRWQDHIEQTVHGGTMKPENTPSSSAHWNRGYQRRPAPLAGSASVTPSNHKLEPEPDAALLLPQGERTFLRFIAVDEETLFCTWDLSSDGRQQAKNGVRIRILNEETQAVLFDEQVHSDAHRWYFRLHDDYHGPTLRALLVSSEGTPIATSNPVIVPRSRPAPPGPLLFATVPPEVSLQQYAEHALDTWVNPETRSSGSAFSVEYTGKEAAPMEETVVPQSLPTSHFRGKDS